MAGALSTDDLDYPLPEERIATHPAEPRDGARMLVHHRFDDRVEHRRVRDLPEYVGRGLPIVFNDTAVAPARILGRRADSGGRVEGLFVGDDGAGSWRLMLKSNGKLRAGQALELDGHDGAPSGHVLELEACDRGEAVWTARVAGDPGAVLDDVGLTPLPPYILRARKERHDAYDDERDRRWYQTVYAEPERRRSVAAPTAGLHFTPELLDAIDRRGGRRLRVTLHVGPGTFRPVTAPTLAEHRMHTEWFEVPPETLAVVRATRVLAVGTTTVRALESLPDPLPEADGPVVGDTDLLIAPPYAFRHVHSLLTNFHLPRSTLLALVAAMVGLDRLLALYAEAVERGYRFYSYGDAMLILP